MSDISTTPLPPINFNFSDPGNQPGFNPSGGNYGNLISDGFGVLGGLIGGLTSPMPNLNLPNPPTFSSNTSNPYFYQPQYQGQVDSSLYGLFQGSPQFNVWGQTQPGLQNYYNASQNNPYASPLTPQGYQSADPNGPNYASPSYQQAANQAGYASNLNAYNQFSLGQRGMNLGAQGLDWAGQAMSWLPNPYQNAALTGAQQGGDALQSVGQNALAGASTLPGMAANYTNALSNYAPGGLAQLTGLAGSTTAGLMPYAQQGAYSLPGVASSYMQPGNAAASSILNTGFDPQGALYSQQFQQMQDQVGAYLAQSGLAQSGTGAGIMNNALQKFNIDWQNQQLGRQTQALGAYNQNANTGYGMLSSAYGQGLGGLESAASGTFNPYLSTYSAGIGGLNTAANTGYGINSGALGQSAQLGATGAQDIMSGAASPYNFYSNMMSNYINQYGGLANVGNAYNQVGTGGAQLGNMGAENYLAAGQIPYQASQNILGNQYLGANNYLSSANQAQNTYLSPAAYLMNYLGGGTNAARSYAGAQNSAYNSTVNADVAAYSAAYSAAVDAARNNQQGTGSLLGGIGSLIGDVLPFFGF